EFDMSKNIAFAHGRRDSAGNAVLDSTKYPIGDPVFNDGEKSFDAKEITYNFQTKKGKISEITTQEGEAFIHAKDAKKDTGEVYYIKNGRYTTCDSEEPDFYIKTTKLKVIPNDKIVSGPAYLVLGDVPTPLVVPFGVFPNKKGRKSGVLIPFYGQSNLGYFFKDGGYYFGISDHMDLALRGDIYTLGSYGLKAHTNYNYRYKNSGNLDLSYSDIKISEKEFPDFQDNKDFFVRWNHTQDPKANPTIRFLASVNAGSSKYNKFNSYNPTDYLSNTFSSNVAWSKSWQGKPINLSVNMSHSQNIITKVADITLPEASFTVSRFYPFRKKEQIGKQKRYEKIGANFTLSAKNSI
ncbi:MAG TPA: putative LPS assembly protein LptD, partial [Bacteroidia bacterium]